MRHPFNQLRNDLFCQPARCNCLNHVGSPTLIRLIGYNDSNFFDRVNAEPRQGSCSNCGRKYQFQWFRDGVEFEWLEDGTWLKEKDIAKSI